MLNAKALGELLSQNSDERLCKRWFLMTPNGTILAYSQPTDIKDLRKQAAITAMSWQEQQRPDSGDNAGEHQAKDSKADHPLHALILETEAKNVLVRTIQPQLLLVLEGGVPPRRRTFEPRIIAEGANGELLHDMKSAESSLGTSISSKVESSMSTAAGSVLGLHRKKLDAMATAIVSEFEQTGFKMPDDNVNRMF